MRKRISVMRAVVMSVLLGLVLVAVSMAQPSDSAEATARVQFTESGFDFGSMYQNEEVTHLFTFRNVGNATLKIEKVKSSCGCTAALPEKRELPPGGETTLKVTFRSGTMRDRVVKHVYVDSNDPVEPRVTLTIEGIVKVEVDLSPKGIYVGNLSVGETSEREVELTPVEAKSFKVLSATSDNPTVRVIGVRPRPDKRPGYTLTVRLGPLDKPGRINGKITIKTDLPHTKEILVPVYGKVVSQEDAASSNK